MTNMIGSRGFGKTPGVFEFMPSYLPKGKTAEQVRDEMSKAIKAAAPSYGVFSAALLNPYSDEHANDQAWKEAIAPLSHIPPATERVGAAVPDARHAGPPDRRRRGEGVRRRAGQGRASARSTCRSAAPATRSSTGSRTHGTKATFAKYGVYYAAAMKAFFRSVLYDAGGASGSR